MKNLIHFFVSNPKLTITLSLLCLVGGIMGLSALNREEHPPVDFATASIVTSYPGASPDEVEEQITNKIEQEIRTIEGIRDVRSISKSGLSTIIIRVEMEGYDTDKVMDDLQRALQRARITATLRDDPIFTRINAKEIAVYELALVGPNKNRKRDILADDLKNVLENVRGVSEVSLAGFNEREFQVLLDRKKLDAYQVGVEEVFNAVRRRNQDTPAGYIERNDERYLVRVRGRVQSIDELGDIPVRSNFSGQSVLIRDIAEVVDGQQEPEIMSYLNGEAATILSVKKMARADSIRIVEALQAPLAAFEKNLPEEYKLVVYNNEAARVEFRLGMVSSNALMGLVLIVVILLIFLPGTAGLMPAISMPLTICATLGLMPVLGANFNVITMLAIIIVLGMLVDNSIVIAENYSRHRKMGLSQVDAATKAAHEFWLPITATACTTIAAFLPMLVTKGVMGEFIKWIPIVVTLTLFVCLFESFFLLPARLRFTLRSKAGEDPSSPQAAENWFDKYVRRFEGFVRKCLARRYLVIGSIGGVFVGSIVLTVVGNRFELFPAEDVEYYLTRFEAPVYTPVQKVAEMSDGLEQQVRNAIGPDFVKHQFKKVGSSVFAFGDPQAKTANYVGIIFTVLHKDKALGSNTNAVLSRMRAIPKGPFPIMTHEAVVGGPPIGKPLNVTFRSASHTELAELVAEIKSELSAIPGVFDIEDDIVKSGTEYEIDIDHTMMARLGLSTDSVGMVLRTALQGEVASELQVGSDNFYLTVRYKDRDRSTVESLSDTSVMDARGNRIPLRNFAKIQEVEGPSERKHFNYLRSVTVTADVDPAKITSSQLNEQVATLFERLSPRYPRAAIDFGGEEESTKESVDSLFTAMILALFGILAILIFLYKGFVRPMIVVSTFFLGSIGVNIAFFLHQKPLSFLALIGMVGLAGVVVNAAIVLVSFLDETVRRDAPLNEYLDQLAHGTSLRLRAICVTTITTVAGLMPTAYGIGGSDSMLVPMTLALAWGLVSGALMTLIWVPCIYAVMNDIFRKFFRQPGF
jgi:multidrug efflux pump subunit AcrB